MATGKYHKWLEPANLERITNWAMKGCTYAEIAKNMGVGERTFYTWVDKFEQIQQAVKTGQEMSIDCIENMAFKVAMGLVEEDIMVKVRGADGSERTEMRKRKIPPNASMLMFLLKNRAGYRSEPKDDAPLEKSAEVPTFTYKRDA